jgi:phosphomannomutase/phosphoglucomutase
VCLFCDPDGRFPNRTPDTKAEGALDAAIARLVAEGADAGLVYDGDADRLAMVDDRGQPVYADRLLALLARRVLPAHPGAAVVYELSCTGAVPDTVTAYGGRPVACPVGYAFVHEKMRATDAILGGESAGHLFFDEPGFRFDDAMLATAKIASLLAQSEEPLSALVGSLPRYVRGPERRFHCPDAVKAQVVDHLGRSFAARGHRIERLDGAQIHFDAGWSLFRQSNTQPAVTLHCEARTRAQLAEIERDMLEAVRAALASAGVEMGPAH